MRRSAVLRALTLGLAFVHTFPAQKHLAQWAHDLSLGEAWKGFGALAAIGLYLLPVRVQARGLRALWRRPHLLRVGGILLAAAHAVPAYDHLPRLIASPSWGDAWRALGATFAVAWFLTPVRVQGAAVAFIGRLSRVPPVALLERPRTPIVDR